MIKNYLTIALRNLRRHTGYTVINVAGLSVGMAVCLLIGLYVADELSFDRFHTHTDRLVVIGAETIFAGRMTATPYPLGPVLEAEVPEVERAVRANPWVKTPVIRPATQVQGDRQVLLADPAFFEVFSFPLLQGDPATVLEAPGTAVITEALARSYFGEESPVGKTLQVRLRDETKEVTVSGVAQNVSSNSTLQFDLVTRLDLLPASWRQEDAWGAYMYQTYVLLKPGSSLAGLEQNMVSAIRSRIGEKKEAPFPFFAVPLPSLYLSDLYETPGFKGQKRYLYIFGSIAFFVLLIAAINYLNLVTAQASRRAREVGIRKAVGAGRSQLVRQFLSESVLLSGASLLVAVGLVQIALPAFNALFDKTLTLDLPDARAMLAGLSVFVLLVGVAAGAYPAFVLSRFDPVRVLRGAGAAAGSEGRLRRVLVVVQFAVSVVLIASTAVIYRQLDYLQTKNLGFDGERVVTIDFPAGQSWQLHEAIRQAALTHPGVQRASVANAAPGRFGIRMRQRTQDLAPRATSSEEDFTFAPGVVDYDFVETLGLHLMAGRNFSQAHPEDATQAYLLNETAVRRLGWTYEEAVGQSFRLRPDAPEGEVIGVVEDFHIASLRNVIEPVVLQIRLDDSWSAPGVLLASLASGNVRDVMAHLESQMERFAPGEPFKYQFLDDTLDAQYRAEERLSRIFATFAGLAILIACLGLFGLAAFTTQQRTKEIGIRKVLGAGVAGLVALLAKDFVKLVIIGFVLAAPIAYFAMNNWLQGFAYRIDLSWEIFLAAGLTALVIALLTVSYQSVKAAVANPVKSLRYE